MDFPNQSDKEDQEGQLFLGDKKLCCIGLFRVEPEHTVTSHWSIT